MSPTRDHVSQVYLGLLDIGPTGDWLRRRIDWMAEEARGPRVLDVGCSEGILGVLLARRGIMVTGVDVDADALDFARQLLGKESDEVRARVELIEGDFTGTQPVTGLFDTVVIGEVLDYSDDPRPILDKGLKHLRPGGRLIVTTPFGVHPHEDNRPGFTLMDLIGLLKPRLGLESLSVEDNHIRFVGRLSEEKDVSWQSLDTEAILAMTDEALAASQTRLYAFLAARGSRIERLQQRLQQRVEVDRATQHKVNKGNEKAKRIEFRAKLDQIALTQLKKLVAARTEEVKARTREVKAREREVEAKAREVEAKARELQLMSNRLHATRSSTSFLVGSTIVDAARRPLTLWKLPFQILRLHHTESTPPPVKTVVPEVTSTPRTYVPEEPELISDDAYPDPSQFIDFPLLPIPESRADGPPVAAILDTFTEHALRQEVNLVLMSPIHWRAQMEKRRPVCLFVESAWRGNNGGWQNLIVGYEGAEDNPLRELLEYCRSNGIPTVFWNKEDPPHFDNFIGAAKEFDYVFTSDADCIPRYKEVLGHDRVYVLPFAAAPRIHNPSREKGWPNYPVCFAGSWVSRRYPERAEALQFLLDPALPKGLHIFDRNLTRPEYGPDYRFPDQYKEAIKGTLTYEEMLTAYRCYDVMLNVNTIADSPTMFARRVFESLACGTPVISSESAGMSRMLEGHVRVTRSLEETKKHLQELLGDEEARIREGHLAYRFVHENHTYRQRIDEVFRRVGLVDQIGSEQPSVSVLMPTMRPQNVARCIENFTKQTYQNKELILILNNADFDLDAIRRDAEHIPNVQVLYIDGRTTLGDCLNRGVEAASGDYVAKMVDDDYYGERYLSDAVLAASFSDAEVVGKGLYFMYFEAVDTTALRQAIPEHTFTSSVTTGGTLFIRTDVCREIPFDSISLKEDTNFQRAAARAGCRVYSADRFNFIRVRTRRSINHSDPTPDAEFLKRCRAQTPGLDLDRAMI